MMKLIEGKVKEIVFKHDASRVIQSCIKYATRDQREIIVNELKGNWVALVTNHYSHFLTQKMLKYGTKEQKDSIITEFYGHIRKLIKHKDAAGVVEYIYNEIANSQQRTSLIEEFYGPEFSLFKSKEKRTFEDLIKDQPEKKIYILKHVGETLIALINKEMTSYSIVHRALLEYFTHADLANKIDMINNIKELLVHMLHTPDGAKVAVQSVILGNAKDRKTIIKTMKSFVSKICKEEHGNVTIMAITDVTDDTVLIEKIILAEMIKSIDDLIEDKHGCLPFLHLMAPYSKTYFTKNTIDILTQNASENITSKKNPEIRRQELLKFILPKLLQVVCDKVDTLSRTSIGCGVIFETIKAAKTDFTDNIATIFNKLAILAKETENNILEDFYGSRLYKKLIAEEFEITNSKIGFASILYDSIKGNIENFALKKGSSFVVCALLDVPATKELIFKEIKPAFNKLQSCDEAGAKILVKILESVIDKSSFTTSTKNVKKKSKSK